MSVFACMLALACSGGASSTMTGPEGGGGSGGGGSASVSDVEVTPAAVDVHVEESARLTLTVTTEAGDSLDRSGEWTVRNASVAVVEGSGSERQVVGRETGTTWVVAVVEGISDSTAVDVTSSSGPSGPTVSRVDLSPSDVTVDVGATADVTLNVTASDGSSLDRSGSWTVTNSSVARLSGSGSTRQVEGLAAGSTRVTASVDGMADTVTVHVTSTGTGGGTQPVAVFDPDDYTSSADLKSDPVEYLGNTDNMHLDTQVPAPGDSQSMRYDYIDQGPGNSISLGREVSLPDSVKPIKELWVEIEVRWSKNYMAIQNLGAGEIAAHKLLFGGAKSRACTPQWQLCDGTGVGRWELIWPATAQNPPDGPALMGTPVQEPSSAGSVLHVTNSINTGDYYDEQWHTIRLHWRHDPGLYELWIDGVKMTSETQSGFTIHPTVQITRLFLGRNKDDGIESGTESLWWGTVKAWTQDPGWW